MAKLKPIRELIRQAQSRPAQALPDETHQSYPIVVRAGGLKVHFLFCPSQLVPADGLYLARPSYRAIFDAESARFEQLEAVSPEDLGVADDMGSGLVRHGLPDGVTADEWRAWEECLYDAFDGLMPAFAAADVGSGQGLADRAREFEDVFARLAEARLRRYYSAIGREFFAWLDTLTG